MEGDLHLAEALMRGFDPVLGGSVALEAVFPPHLLKALEALGVRLYWEGCDCGGGQGEIETWWGTPAEAGMARARVAHALLAHGAGLAPAPEGKHWTLWLRPDPGAFMLVED